MHEISPDDVQHLIGGDRVLYASLTYQPRVRSFRVAKAALKRLGAVYDWKLRAWRVPASQDVLEPLERLLQGIESRTVCCRRRGRRDPLCV
jgi:hypothetical protein